MYGGGTVKTVTGYSFNARYTFEAHCIVYIKLLILLDSLLQEKLQDEEK